VRLVDLAHLGLHLRQRQARVLCQCHSVPPLFPNNSSAVNILTLGGIWTYPTAGPNPPAWGGVPGYTSTLHPSLNSAKRLLPSPQGQSRWCTITEYCVPCGATSSRYFTTVLSSLLCVVRAAGFEPALYAF